MSAERITHVAPLGLRLWDDGAGAVVCDELEVRAAPEALPEVERTASRSASGAFVFHALRELAAFERGEQGSDRAAPVVGARVLRVSVTHARGEFLPVSFLCDAPQRGFARPRVSSLTVARPLVPFAANAPTPSVPLFPSVTRVVRGGVAVVRAELRVARVGAPVSYDDLTPGAWAVVEASMGTRVLGRALADAQGRVQMAFPYPALGVAATAARWSVDFAVFHVTASAPAKRADLDLVMTSPRRALRPRGAPAFAPTLTRELRPNQALDLGALELQP